jgi:hypothetical protein
MQQSCGKISAHNSFARPPPIYRRANRHCGQLDQPESARRRTWLSPFRSTSLLMAGRRGFAGVTLHGHLGPGHPAASVPACPTPRAAHLGASHLERAKDGEGHTAAGRVPSGQSAHSQPGRSGSRSHGLSLPTRNRCSTRSRRFTTRRSKSAAAQRAPRRRVVASFTPTVHPSGHPSQPETTIPLFAHCEFRSTRSMMVGVV